MKFKLALSLIALLLFAATAFAQTELTIKRKSSIKIPGMEAFPAMPGGVQNPMGGLEDRKSTIYIKGSRMRTESKNEQPTKSGGKETVTKTTILQCDKKRELQFNNKWKKYYVEPISTVTSASVKTAKKAGYVTITGSVVDTGERAKLFGYVARHLKQNITLTPSANACQKETVQVEIEGWYADIPEFTCPAPRKPTEFQMGKNCFDEVVDQIQGSVTGIPVKEVKKITMQGGTIIIEEEVVEILKTPLADLLFEPPTNYSAVKTLQEVDDDSLNDASSATNETTQSNGPSTFALPSAGIEQAPVAKSGLIRIGIAKPKVTTPESKNNPGAGDGIATAVGSSLVESLRAQNVEAIQLDTDFPENEAKEKGCDYIFYAVVTQKHGGSGMFGKMILMGAVTMAGAMVPGVGGMIASTVASQVMGQTMSQTAKAKDEFTLDYKVFGLDKTLLSQAVSKIKTDQDGQDVMTPQLQQASKAVLAEIAKKR